MPTYAYECQKCGTRQENWRSFQDDSPEDYKCVCGATVVRIYEHVMTNGVGVRGQHYAEVEAREKRWGRDMPAYKRFRDKGYQPPQIDGCDHLEATAQNALWINSGGRVKVDETRYREAKATAEDIVAGRAVMADGF